MACVLVHQPVNNFNGFAGSNQRRASAPANTTAYDNKPGTDIPSRCSGGYARGCSCLCRTCPCRRNPVHDDANRDNSSGGGGRPLLGPTIPTTASEFRPSSLDTNDSDDTNYEIVNSFEVSGPLNDRMAADEWDHTHHTNSASVVIQNVDTAFLRHDQNESPWPEFISPADEPVSGAQSEMDIEIMAGSSLSLEVNVPTSGATSIASIRELAGVNMATSETITGTGTRFAGNSFLLLSPECRHERTRQMCEHCMHF